MRKTTHLRERYRKQKHMLPVRISEQNFNRHFLPFLSVSDLGRKPGIPLWKIFNYILYQLHTPTVSLGVTSAVVSSCGHDSGQIEPRVAHELAGHWATHAGPAKRPPHRHPSHAQPSHPGGRIMAGVRGCPRGVAPIKHHAAMRDNPVVAYGRSNAIIAPSFLVMRCPDGGPLFASSRWLLHT